MEKNVKFENGVLTSTKTITESDVLEMFKEGKLKSFKIFNDKFYDGCFRYKGNVINFSDITLDNVLEVYVCSDPAFEDYYNYEGDDYNFNLCSNFLKVYSDETNDCIKKKDFESLYDHVIGFIDESWFNYRCDFDSYIHIYETIYKDHVYDSVKKHLSEEEYSYFRSYVEEDLILTYDPFVISSEKYAKELLSEVRAWREVNEQ